MKFDWRYKVDAEYILYYITPFRSRGTMPAAYGFRWKEAFGRDQLELLVKLLEKEPSSRHGVVVTWDPREDGLGNPESKKNIPCPYTFIVNIINDKLHLHSILRSNDMMLGCPHDVAG